MVNTGNSPEIALTNKPVTKAAATAMSVNKIPRTCGGKGTKTPKQRAHNPARLCTETNFYNIIALLLYVKRKVGKQMRAANTEGQKEKSGIAMGLRNCC